MAKTSGWRTPGWIIAPAIVGACTGRSDLTQEAPPITDAYRPIEGSSDPLWVPAGRAYIGGIHVLATEEFKDWKDPSYSIDALPCDDLEFSGFVHVDGFYLDADEVSPASYAQCVEDGACEEAPERTSDQPALYVPVESAEAFCAYRGGALPSYAQFARAASGDELSVGQRAVLLTWAECMHNPFPPEECAELLRRAPDRMNESLPTLAPRSDPADVGPHGHNDLFGAQVEWTRSRSNFDGFESSPHMLTCGGPELEDPIHLGNELRLLYGPGMGVLFGYSGPSIFESIVQPYSENVLSSPLLQAWRGFRCAYEAEEPEQ